MPLHSLRVRLILTMVAILAVTIAAAALLFSRLTQVTFDRYMIADQLAFESRFAQLLVAHHARSASWAGIEPVLEQIASLSGRRPLLLDSLDHPVVPLVGYAVERTREGSLVVERHGPGVDERTMRISIRGPAGILRGAGGRAVGRFLLLPANPPEPPPGLERPTHALEPHVSRRVFLGPMNRSLALVVIGAGLLALLLTAALARRVLAPVEELTAAVRGLEPGRAPPRVAVRGRDEIGTLALAFNAMAERVTLAEKLRRDLVSDVAHELRTPLHNLRGQIEALQDRLAPLDDARLASLHEEVLLLGGLVEDLQELAQAEAGQLRLSRRPLAPRDEVERALASVSARAREAGIALALEAPPDLPAVDADRGRLGQVLRNLLENAVAHTPPGGTITVRARGTGAAVEFEVLDTGTGIAPEHVPHVFDRFHRTDPSRSRETGGAGLGLAIVRQLIEAHGGVVRVASVPGAGSTFAFTLPAAVADRA